MVIKYWAIKMRENNNKRGLIYLIPFLPLMGGCFVDPSASEDNHAIHYSQASELNHRQSYAVGAQFGRFASTHIERESKADNLLDKELIVKGFIDVLNGKGSISVQDVDELISEMKKRSRQLANDKVLEELKQKNEAYLVTNSARENVTVTASGLQIEVLKQGSGKTPSETDYVQVRYKGRLIDGTLFDAIATPEG
ncbi:FKBP-type peptidyl-prolyl cis-trans isomerase N-terminal domain-containing protein, partial [Pseudoalteromonas piscicida]